MRIPLINKKASCASCFILQAQNLISQHVDATIELASPRGFSINPEKPVDVATSTFIGDTVEHRQLLDGLVSMIGPALTNILSDLREQITNSPDGEANLVKFNEMRSKLSEIIQKAITGIYKVGNDESIPLFMRQLEIINELWLSTRTSHQE